MPVEDLAARVAEVLSRAESLFAPAPASWEPGEAGGPISDAATANRAVAQSTSELSGAMASTHAEAVSGTADRLERAADAEGELARHLARATDTHTEGRSHASSLRASVAEIPASLGVAAHVPAGEIATVNALRNRVARMHALVKRHAAESAELAQQIRNLGYRA